MWKKLCGVGWFQSIFGNEKIFLNYGKLKQPTEARAELRGAIWVGIRGMCPLMGREDPTIILAESFVSSRNQYCIAKLEIFLLCLLLLMLAQWVVGVLWEFCVLFQLHARWFLCAACRINSSLVSTGTNNFFFWMKYFTT